MSHDIVNDYRAKQIFIDNGSISEMLASDEDQDQEAWGYSQHWTLQDIERNRNYYFDVGWFGRTQARVRGNLVGNIPLNKDYFLIPSPFLCDFKEF